MTGEAYTQISRPVNRLAEKILGWLSWILLLGATVVAMFFGLVLFSNENSIQRLENGVANNATLQDFLASNNLNATQLVIMLQNGVWAFIVYLIVCLLISFLALISMNHRIVSGLLFLLVAIITLPLFFILVPLFFFIVALMMFGRKEKYELVPMYQEMDGYPSYRENTYYEDEGNMPHTQPVHVNVENEETHAEKEGTSDDEPVVLSRSAKYNHKPIKKNENEQSAHDSNDAEDDTLIYDSRTMLHQTEAEQDVENDITASEEYGEADTVTSPEALKAQRKQEKAELKAQRKEEKKARKAYEKEQRKHRVSASTQRRQNYDNRLKLQQDRPKQSAEDSEQEDEKQ